MLYKKINKEVALVDVEFLQKEPLKLRSKNDIIPFIYKTGYTIWDFCDKLNELNCNLLVGEYEADLIEDPILLENEFLVLFGECVFINIKEGKRDTTDTEKWEFSDTYSNYKLLIFADQLIPTPIPEEFILYKGF